jgi:hypothetical protein
MIKTLTFTIFLSFLPLYASGNTVELFNQHITIPAKYKLEALSSINAKSRVIKYRSGNFFRAPENNKLEIITIGKLSDYIFDNEKEKIEELGVTRINGVRSL